MIIFFIISALFAVQTHFDVLKFFAKISLFFQNNCKNLSSNLPIFQDIHSALLCGSSLNNTDFTNHLKTQSLIHLFIVSGGHFLFLEKFFTILKVPEILKITLLALYNICTGFQEPGTRSICFLLSARFLKKTSLYLRSDQILLLVGVFLPVIFPSYLNSSSFLLSWTAALSLNISSFLFFKFDGFLKIFLTQIFITAILAPWLCAFGNLHPLSILINMIFGPYIIVILFPLSGVIILISDFAPLFEHSISLLNLCLSQTANLFIVGHSTKIPILYFWAYLIFLHVGFHVYQIKFWQKTI